MTDYHVVDMLQTLNTIIPHKQRTISLSTTSRIAFMSHRSCIPGELGGTGIKPLPTARSTGSHSCYSDPVLYNMFCMHDNICLVVKGERKTNVMENTITCVLDTIADINVCSLHYSRLVEIHDVFQLLMLCDLLFSASHI